jgi:protein involved in sex pheromone biosynthesis
MKKTLIIGMLILALVLQGFTPHSYVEAATKFTDVQGHWSENDVEFMVEQGAISGYGDVCLASKKYTLWQPIYT